LSGSTHSADASGQEPDPHLHESPLIVHSKWIAPLVGLVIAMIAHATHNILSTLFQSPAGMSFTTVLDWLGWFLMLLFIIIIMAIEGKQIKKYLKPEVEKGVLTEEQYEQSTSALKLIYHRIKALFQGKGRQRTQFYRTAAELSLKKKNLKRFGDRNGNGDAVASLREKLSELSKSIAS
jgi:hypothetical protein